MKMNLIKKLIQEGIDVQILNTSHLSELQTFLSLFQDFFLTCEGQQGTAEGILKACPPSKDPSQDKVVLGIYENHHLRGVIDLVQDYPEEGVWTIGYLLVHPHDRSKGKGRAILEHLSTAIRELNGKKLRCVVQAQNPRALNFWINCGFEAIKTLKQALGSQESATFILEKML